MHIAKTCFTDCSLQIGGAESAGLENVGPETVENAGPIMSSLRDQKYSTGKCGIENAGPESAGPNMQGSKMQDQENAGPGRHVLAKIIFRTICFSC